MDKRFIEDSFPVKEVSKESSREKDIRSGHISSLHVWWARRPLSSSRVTSYASLIPATKDEIDWVKKKNFIIELAKWENTLNYNMLDKARKDIFEYYDTPPKVLDPFSGGGAIPLEAMRLGCETYANDYNPVAVLLEKCSLEFPMKYGKNKENLWVEGSTPLINDIEKWGKWVLNKTEQELGKFYPKDKDGSVPIAYLWAKTIKCVKPSCELEIPLMKKYWLANKNGKKIALMPVTDDNSIHFEIVGQDNKIPDKFDPSKGSIDNAICDCVACSTRIEGEKTREIFREGKTGEIMVALVLKNPNERGKIYKLPSKKDFEIFQEAKNQLGKKIEEFTSKWGFNPIPDEPTPESHGRGAERAFPLRSYGLNKWGDVFNARQKLALITFLDHIKELRNHLLSKGYDEEYANVIQSYISLAFSKFSTTSNILCRWNYSSESFAGKPDQYGMLSMRWDYPESNPFSMQTGSFHNHLKSILGVKVNQIHYSTPINISQYSATSLGFDDNYFDAVFTDPPYYDNIPYSFLSDFFYVWLKRAIGEIYPDIFLTPLTPKKNEIVAYTIDKSWDESKEFFEKMLKNSFKEINRVLKPNGIAIIVYAHKTTEGWETVINSLIDSGLTVTASWPLSTERKSRQRAQNSAALRSSIYIVARKFEKKDIGWYSEIKDEIRNYIPKKLDKLWEEGISGADFFIAAIGSAIEVFGKYKKVMDNKGNEIRAKSLLSFVRSVVTNYTVKQILENGIADELSSITKFYILWRWNYQEASVEFDEARKLAQSAGIDLANEWNKGLIIKRSSSIRVLGPDKRDIDSLEDSKELIDILHHVCILWKDGKQDEIGSVLKNSHYNEGGALDIVAQAISETLPNNSSEKKMIEGFFASREKIIRDIREDESQTKLV